ncbi:MAG: dNTP triphosphohydrolase [Candidatus Marinimicrobia bacterium]|nr:dNTP triphosphohydrolase [Candidatus Neomarinimicrobiota bacterium]
MNNFYNDFDKENLENKRTEDFRSIFQMDRDRILHSNAFRRLQNKTQVFVSGDYDFYRTRLTHSLEVSQIGKSLVNYINKHEFGEAAIDSDLVEGICLAHDIGNPAFGHAGEKHLNELMLEYGGFEGNAQSLKIITETIHESDSYFSGMKPSRAFTDGIMKYKILWKDRKKEGKFLYNEQQKYLDFIYDGENDLKEKSLECQIMEWADDVAYSLHDLSDGFSAGFINEKNIFDWAVDTNASGEDEHIINDLITKVERREKFDRFIAKRIGLFIENTTLKQRNNNMSAKSNRYKYGIEIPKNIRKEIELYKRLSFEIIFQSPQVQQLEFKGQQILEKIFKTLLFKNGNLQIQKSLLPINLRAALKRNPPQSIEAEARFICDYIANQTDRSIVRFYKRLFDPDFGSLVDII